MITIMFHSVGLCKLKWSSSNIAEEIEPFEGKIQILKRAGFQSVSMAEAHKNLKSPARLVCLTFDDGYLDNWVHVFPVLQKYAMKATFFVTPEFADPRNIIRPRQEPGTVRDAEHEPKQCCAGFLSWREMREMEQTGIVEVQSHALTHAWYFKGPKIVDFWYPGIATAPPGRGRPWMLWEKFPELKFSYLTKASEYEHRIPYGTPIYESGKSLVTRRFFPNNALDTILPEYVERNGGKDFFLQGGWRQKLDALVAGYQEGRNHVSNMGRFESDVEYIDRVKHELADSKNIIERELNKTVKGICWPGGAVDDEVLRLAKQVGYKYFTLPSAWKTSQAKGQYSDMLPRMGSVVRIMYKGRDLGSPSAKEFLWRVERNRGSRFYKWLIRFSILVRLLFSYGKSFASTRKQVLP